MRRARSFIQQLKDEEDIVRKYTDVVVDLGKYDISRLMRLMKASLGNIARFDKDGDGDEEGTADDIDGRPCFKDFQELAGMTDGEKRDEQDRDEAKFVIERRSLRSRGGEERGASPLCRPICSIHTLCAMASTKARRHVVSHTECGEAAGTDGMLGVPRANKAPRRVSGAVNARWRRCNVVSHACNVC